VEPVSSSHSFPEIMLFIAILAPLASFVISFSIDDKYSWAVSITAPFFLFISTVAALFVFLHVWNNEPYNQHWNWFSIGSSTISFSIFLDNVAVLMLLLVTFTSFLVHLYSLGYMAGDEGLKRYFAMLGFFTFSMLAIIVANNVFLLFMFWELVGFASYTLIGHWKEKPAAARAATKAFLMNRIGDAGFLIGLMFIWANTQTFDLQQLILTSSVPAWWQLPASLFLLGGVIGKSAQLPLLTWLPDAMEGPTPVSALIHAATMVAAGVYLLIRMHFIFPPMALDIVTALGVATALAGALSATVQSDLKRILAFSTISQLGLMVAAAGAGSPEAAILHLFTHAFFKACLFLSAGSVIHTLHQAQHQAHITFDQQNIYNLGGLRKKLPFTFITFLISGSALAGLPLTAGFLSKEAILAVLLRWNDDAPSWRWIITAMAFAVTLLTVIYIFRLLWFVFTGEERETKNLAIEESPVVMRIPMAILALCSFWFIASFNPFSFTGWMQEGVAPGFGLTVFSTAWVFIGIAFGYWLFRTKPARQIPALQHVFYLDAFYRSAIVQPVIRLSVHVQQIDRKWIDGFIHALAYLHVIIAHVIGWFDRTIVDGVVNSIAFFSRVIGSLARSFQGGKIQLYVFWAVFAIIIFLIWSLN
jgi:NADH-quinone oxidoreductase subunit L